MDFELTEEQELIQEMTRRFLEERCTMGKVRELLDDPTGFDRDGWREAAELGWTGILVPEKYGGGGIGETPIGDLVVIAEELGRALQPGPFLPTNVVTYAIAEFGSDAVALDANRRREEFARLEVQLPLGQDLLVRFVKSCGVIDHFQNCPGAFDAEKVIAPVVAVTKSYAALPLVRLRVKSHRDRVIGPKLATLCHSAYKRVRVRPPVIDRLR